VALGGTPVTEPTVLSELSRRYTTPEEQVYLRTHAQRYTLLLELVERLIRGQTLRGLLVVGPSYESVLLREAFPGVLVNTLGWQDHRFPLREGELHVEFDLNDDDYPELEQHDLVVCGEVIEHLRVSPLPVLRFLARGLTPRGHLIVQTPNAAALPKRLRLLLGRNPYEPIRAEPRNPGHFHEYTLEELRDAVEGAGLHVTQVLAANYFDHGSRKNKLYRAAGRVLPPSLREGITVVARSG
jgi:SAM-dependent methyltransferase